MASQDHSLRESVFKMIASQRVHGASLNDLAIIVGAVVEWASIFSCRKQKKRRFWYPKQRYMSI